MQELLDDFAGVEISLEAAAGAGAKVAAHGAADLGGDAAGCYAGAEAGHEDGFNGGAIVEGDQELEGSIRGLVTAEDCGSARGKMGIEMALEVMAEEAGIEWQLAVGLIKEAEDAGGMCGLVAGLGELALEAIDVVISQRVCLRGAHLRGRFTVLRAGLTNWWDLLRLKIVSRGGAGLAEGNELGLGRWASTPTLLAVRA
jgi:hypothetical protein